LLLQESVLVPAEAKGEKRGRSRERRDTVRVRVRGFLLGNLPKRHQKKRHQKQKHSGT
jgi:hypothetical protein